MTFKKKLWLYFTLFTAFIFTILWLLQTVFLQGFYNSMLIRNTRKVAEEIAENGADEQINDIIDRLARDNSVLVFVTDKNGNLLYGSDEYKEIQNKLDMRKQGKTGTGKETDEHDIPTDKEGQINGSPDRKKHGNRTELPDSFEDIYSGLTSGSEGSVEIDMEGLFAYGTYIDYPGSEDGAILYISTTKDAVGSSVRIIRLQLIWVTVISLGLGFILSGLLARKFSDPVDNLSKKAKHLGTKEYENGFGN